MDIDQVEVLVDEWVREVQACGIEQEVGYELCQLNGEWEGLEEWEGSDPADEVRQEAWDDVHGGGLPVEKVVAARGEEVGFMEDRGIWTLRPVAECWQKTGKAPVSVRWVDTNKGTSELVEVRSRLVARDFKGGILVGMICLRKLLRWRLSVYS